MLLKGHNMKKYLGVVILSIVVSVATVIGYNAITTSDASLGSAIKRDKATVVTGTSTNFSRMPKSIVEANSTTTDDSLDQGGVIFQQLINNKNAQNLIVTVGAVGGTATSTMYFQIQISNDGDNWFNPLHATTSTAFATTTYSIVNPAIVFVPGLATTTWSFELSEKTKFVRLLSYGDDLSTDPNDFVKAWIEVSKEGEL